MDAEDNGASGLCKKLERWLDIASWLPYALIAQELEATPSAAKKSNDGSCAPNSLGSTNPTHKYNSLHSICPVYV